MIGCPSPNGNLQIWRADADLHTVPPKRREYTLQGLNLGAAQGDLVDLSEKGQDPTTRTSNKWHTVLKSDIENKQTT